MANMYRWLARESRSGSRESGETTVPKTMDPEDVELLKLIADGTTHFRPVQDEPSDSPRWVGQVERLRRPPNDAGHVSPGRPTLPFPGA